MYICPTGASDQPKMTRSKAPEEFSFQQADRWVQTEESTTRRTVSFPPHRTSLKSSTFFPMRSDGNIGGIKFSHRILQVPNGCQNARNQTVRNDRFRRYDPNGLLVNRGIATLRQVTASILTRSHLSKTESTPTGSPRRRYRPATPALRLPAI